MDEIKTLIALMSKEEIDGFHHYLRARNKVGTRQSSTFLKSILAGQPNELRLKMSTNAYNTLKSRFLKTLKHYTAETLFQREKSVDIELMKQLILARKLLQQKAYKLGFKALDDIEKLAIDLNQVHFLTEVYQLMLTYSYSKYSPEQIILVEKSKHVQAEIVKDMNLNLAYSQIRRAFYDHDRNVESFSIERLLSETYAKFDIQYREGYNFKSLYQIAEMSNISGSYSRNYFHVDLYFESLISTISGSAIDSLDNLVYHIDLLYIMAHIYFRKKQFKKSIAYLQKMEKQLDRNKQQYRKLKEMEQQALLALNLNYLGKAEEAAKLLDQIIPSTYAGSRAEDTDLQAILARIMIHFQQNELSLANQKMNRLKRSDNWYITTVGLEWLLHKKFMEILLHIELGHTDSAEKLIESLWRKRVIYFVGSNQLALPFLKLIKLYHQNPLQSSDTSFTTQVEAAFDWKPNEEEDLFLMSFYAWLKSKMVCLPLYEVTLKLIRN